MENKTLLKRIIGNYIRLRRQEKNLTLEQLAEKANSNDKYIGQIERGEKLPSVQMLFKLSDSLNMDLDQLRQYVNNDLSKN